MNTPMHHRGVRIEFIGIIHVVMIYSPLNLKLIVIFIIIVSYHMILRLTRKSRYQCRHNSR